RRGAPGLELDRRGEIGPGGRCGRRHRVALGTTGGGVPPGDRAPREAAGAASSLMLTLGRRLSRPLEAAPLLLGLPRLPWLWAGVGVVALFGAAVLVVLVRLVIIRIVVFIQQILSPFLHVSCATSADPSQASIL